MGKLQSWLFESCVRRLPDLPEPARSRKKIFLGCKLRGALQQGNSMHIVDPSQQISTPER